MRTPQRKPNREAVAQSLRELKILFGEKRPAATNTKARRQPGLGEAEIKLRTNHTKNSGGAT